MKKISLLAFIISLFAVFSFSSITFAQIVANDSGLTELNAQQLADLNNMPSVEINNLVLSKNIFSLGEKVTGTFTVKNDKNYNLPDLKYQISLAGDYRDGLAGTLYGSKIYGPVFLDASGQKKIDFSYLLPSNVAGKNLGIQIQFFTGTGLPLAWADSFIEVIGSSSVLNISDSYLSLGAKKYDLQAGPILSAEKKGILFVKIQNPLSQEQILTPEIKIYDKSVSGELLQDLKLPSFAIASKAEKVFQWEISYMDKAGVYEFSTDFLDKNSQKMSTSILTRYIVGGSIVTIQSVSADKNSLQANENYTVKIAYTGMPFDIDNINLPEKINILNIEVNVSNEDSQIISTYKNRLDFNKGMSLEIPLTASTSAKNISLDIKVTDDKGNIVTSFSNKITNNFFKEDGDDNGMIYIIGILLLVILAIIFVFFRRNKTVKTLVILLAILFSSSLFSLHSASANSFVWTNYKAHYANVPMILTINSPSSTLLPGQVFTISGSIKASACHNSVQVIKFNRYAIATSSGGGKYAQSYSISNANTGSSGGNGYATSVFNLKGNTNYPLIAPSVPGDYYIVLTVLDYWDNGSTLIDHGTGYIKFTVVAPAPTCTDGIKNGTETGIDCGGSCPNACAGTTSTTTGTTTDNGTGNGTTTDNGATATNCTGPDGSVIASGGYLTYYLSQAVTSPAVCTSQDRHCTNGSLSGDYIYSYCTVSSAPLSCSLSIINPNKAEKINVNTLTTWEATSTTVNLINRGTRWTIVDSNGTTTVDSANNLLNKIFTTIGVKTLSVAIASTTAGVYQDCKSANLSTLSTATTSVVYEGGETRER